MTNEKITDLLNKSVSHLKEWNCAFKYCGVGGDCGNCKAISAAIYNMRKIIISLKEKE